MKVLLIHPKLEGDFFEGVMHPPLGLMYIAEVLRCEQYDVKILDAGLFKDQMQEIDNIVREYEPDVVGLSVSTSVMRTSCEIAEHIKDICKEAKIIFGGVHPTLFPRDVIKEHGIDYVVYGEGEKTILELLKAIEVSKEPSEIKGIAYRRNGESIVNAPRSLIGNLDELPFPAYDLIPLKKYFSPQSIKKPFMSMITSRGCPYKCIFCDVHAVFGRKYRFHSPERVVEEMQYLIDRFHIKEVMFKDSEFTLRQERVEKICDLILEKKISIVWSCNSRVGSVSLPLLQKMRRAGCRVVQFGVESGDQKILDVLKKRITIEQIKETFRSSRKAGLKTLAAIMIGNPGETKRSIEKTVELIREIKPTYSKYTFLTPFPGTELYSLAYQNGWLLDNFDPFSMKFDTCVMNATEMTTEDLQKMFHRLYKSFYLRPAYLFRRVFTLSPYQWKMNLEGFSKIFNLSKKHH